MNVQDHLERVLAKLAAFGTDGERKTGIIQFHFIDQRWILDLAQLTLAEGEAETADTMVDVDNDTFAELCARTLTMEEATESRRMFVSGDASLLSVLSEGGEY